MFLPRLRLRARRRVPAVNRVTLDNKEKRCRELNCAVCVLCERSVADIHALCGLPKTLQAGYFHGLETSRLVEGRVN